VEVLWRAVEDDVDPSSGRANSWRLCPDDGDNGDNGVNR